MHGQGIGTKSAVFFLAWAEELEMKGKVLMADSVFHRAIENSAQPLEMLLHQYQNFTIRASQNISRAQVDNSVRSGPMSPAIQQSMSTETRDGLQPETLGNSQLINQEASAVRQSHLNAVSLGLGAFPKSQGNIENGCSGNQSTLNTYVTVSKSLVAITSEPAHQTKSNTQEAPHEPQQIAMYNKDVLFSGDREMCFEEIRAQNYIAKMQQNERSSTKSDEIKLMEQTLEQLKMQLKLTEEQTHEIAQTSSQNTLQLATTPSTLPTKAETPSSAAATKGTGRREDFEENSSLGACARPVRTASFTEAALLQCQPGASLLMPKMDDKQRSLGSQPAFPMFGEPESSINKSRTELEPPSRSLAINANESSNEQQVMNESGNSSRMGSFSRPKEGNVLGITMNLSRTPNSSFGMVQPTPSKVLPSPTVCTKEAFDVIMHMFQTPVIPELAQVNENGGASEDDQMQVQEGDSTTYCERNDIHQSQEHLGMNVAPPSTVPFSIFEDDAGAVKSVQNTLKCKTIDSRPLGELCDRQSVTRKEKTSSQNTLQLVTTPSSLPTKTETPSSAAATKGTGRREDFEENSSLGACARPVRTASFTEAALLQCQHGASLLMPKMDDKQRSLGSQPAFPMFGEPESSINKSRTELEPPSRSLAINANESSNEQQLMNESGNSSRMGSFSRPKEGNVLGITMNLSRTPNSSFGMVQPTPSKVLPSPTVCTKEAFDVIMHMFQTPVIPELAQVNENGGASEDDQMQVQEGDSTTYCERNDIHQSMENLGMNVAPPSTVPFSIFEDDAGAVKSVQNTLMCKTIDSRPLGELCDRQSVTRKEKEINDQDRSVWAVFGNKTLTSYPNITEDLTFTAALASTPFYGVPQHPKRDSEECGEKITEIKNDGFTARHSTEEEHIQLAKIRKLSSIQELGLEADNHLSVPAFDSNTNRDASEECQTVEEGLELSPLPSHEEYLDSLIPEQSFYCLDEMHCSDLQFDEEMNETSTEPGVIIRNPWNKDLIRELLSNLTKPLSSYSSFMTWKGNMPVVRPKNNLRLGNEIYQVSYLLGEGSFAHVYQATLLDMNNLSDVKNQHKVSLKVQKISSPWEFYISTQLRERLKSKFCNLYNNINSGHFFQNGCILVGELYSFGTLLNAANLYKTLVEKSMPEPLVIYFAIHILYIVEQLHNIGLIHGDIKPDNFILGERFLDSEAASVDDSLSQGLTLIDFGQSIDMHLFPKNAVFVENCKTSGFQCIEMLTEKPWTFQADYFGIAATVYCLLFGTYLKLKKEMVCGRSMPSLREVITQRCGSVSLTPWCTSPAARVCHLFSTCARSWSCSSRSSTQKN
ncbi:mitotic checkpoint serine/threonine-protein kinase BUB1 isoform X2 [Amblyraja radiata]|uniref:mitotic checkpoint serine/threonine-protein kinase BUB1 isoform X2 n=1 Tax=Amblyraja radiata TaxID=386614 RepID=UPI0014022B9F|nr:mitotic checkpoint serine/threonine-protein kinase BUB1 isoform X2 [Amblyraja radiata]